MLSESIFTEQVSGGPGFVASPTLNPRIAATNALRGASEHTQDSPRPNRSPMHGLSTRGATLSPSRRQGIPGQPRTADPPGTPHQHDEHKMTRQPPRESEALDATRGAGPISPSGAGLGTPSVTNTISSRSSW
eukprot:8000729-Alexandrium_andersonii.AAC.1